MLAAFVQVSVGQLSGSPDQLYGVCVHHNGSWEWAGQSRLRVTASNPQCECLLPLPVWLLVVLVVLLTLVASICCFVLSVCSALDPVSLSVLCQLGSPLERRFSQRIGLLHRPSPHHAPLLGPLIIGSVAWGGASALMADGLRVAVSGNGSHIGWSTLLLTGICFIFLGLVPQMLCTWQGLRIGAQVCCLGRILLFLTSPVSIPLGKLLDIIFQGKEMGKVLECGRLCQLVWAACIAGGSGGVSGRVDERGGVRSGGPRLRATTVEKVMTPLNQCFMLNLDATLDFQTMSEVMRSGYSRVPVYEEERGNVVELLCVCDLECLDPADCTPLRSFTRFYGRPLHFVFSDTRLDAMLDEFKRGRSQLAVVQRVNSEGEGDPFYEVLGIVTLEDVVEEIIRTEVLSETQAVVDKRGKRKEQEWTETVSMPLPPIFPATLGLHPPPKLRISHQLLLTTHRFLLKEVPAFKDVSGKALLRLLRLPVVTNEYHRQPTLPIEAETTSDHFLYRQGEATDGFILILQGRVEVIVGQEGMKFETGSFSYFGTPLLSSSPPSSTAQSSIHSTAGVLEEVTNSSDMLESTNHPLVLQNMFIPDYTVRALSDLQYIKISRPQFHTLISRLAVPGVARSLPQEV
uniref:Metal transporter n=1 Tax=Eptatretus burgeri TaxID=7764 RepID=A0A8C4QDW9_EPTBU